ncbi:MAG: hypothetical protein ACRDY6_06530 [Acidimicrobiia bacterium]
MAAVVPIGDVDILRDADVRALAQHSTGPCVSVYLPTHRHGAETLQGPIRLRNLLDDADKQLRDHGLAAQAVEDLLARLRALLDDADFWQHLSDGLALFAAPGWHLRVRVPLSLPEEVTAAASFRIRPLVPLLSGDGVFFVLLLSQNAVRIFEATRVSIAEVDPGPMPTSMGDALAHEDPETQLQFRSSRGIAQFHGHGAGGEIDKAALERFLRAVDRGLHARLGASTYPLVLACVAYYVPIFRSVTRYAHVLEVAVEGNPEHRRPDELHAAAWELVRPHFATTAERARARYQQAAGTGAAVSGIAEIVTRAREGRIDTIFVAPGPPEWGRVDPDTGTLDTHVDRSLAGEDLVDRAVLDTIRGGGTVVAGVPVGLPADTAAVALLRY